MGLKESKKNAIGSIHENGGGKFEILERWFDEETDTIMLKYKYLNNGEIEINKEANVNASEWKWKKVRGLAGSKAGHHCSNEDTINMINMEEYFEGIYIRLEKHNTENSDNFRQLQKVFAEQHRMLLEMMSIIQIQQKQIDNLVNDRNLVNKLLEKI